MVTGTVAAAILVRKCVSGKIFKAQNRAQTIKPQLPAYAIAFLKPENGSTSFKMEMTVGGTEFLPSIRREKSDGEIVNLSCIRY